MTNEFKRELDTKLNGTVYHTGSEWLEIFHQKNEEKKAKAAQRKLKRQQDLEQEFVGQIIDIFEDVLAPEDAVLIEGVKYDRIALRLKSLIKNWKIK